MIPKHVNIVPKQFYYLFTQCMNIENDWKTITATNFSEKKRSLLIDWLVWA